MTDTKKHKIVVSGSFNQEKLLKKLIKVTGKDIEIVVKNEKDDDESEIVQKTDEIIAEKTEESEKVLEEVAEAEKIIEPTKSDEHKEMEKIMMFNDENANARCTIS